MVRKECSNKSIYKNNKEYICNPKSGRFVKMRLFQGLIL